MPEPVNPDAPTPKLVDVSGLTGPEQPPATQASSEAAGNNGAPTAEAVDTTPAAVEATPGQPVSDGAGETVPAAAEGLPVVGTPEDDADARLAEAQAAVAAAEPTPPTSPAPVASSETAPDSRPPVVDAVGAAPAAPVAPVAPATPVAPIAPVAPDAAAPEGGIIAKFKKLLGR